MKCFVVIINPGKITNYVSYQDRFPYFNKKKAAIKFKDCF